MAATWLFERSGAGAAAGAGDVSDRVPPAYGGGGPGPGGGMAADPARLGLWFFLGTVSMLFIGFTSAYMVRRTSADWRPVAMPPLLWATTASIAASSLMVERARRATRRGRMDAARAAFAGAAALAALFAGGQVLAWKTLAAAGVFLSTNPHSAFLYVLTGAHLVHVAGGLFWAGAALSRLRRAAGGDPLALFATYWHFLGALWVYLLLLLFVF